MKNLKLVLLLSSLFSLLSTGCSPSKGPMTQMRPMMGTFAQIKIYDADRVGVNDAMEAAFSEIERIENLLSKYKDTSEVSKVNRAAAKGPVKVSEETLAIIKKAIEFSKKTEGTFDITVGPLMQLWGFVNRKSQIANRKSEPTKEEIEGALKRVGYQKLEIDEKNKKVRFKRSGVEIDFGGVGKGYAVDRAIEILREKGIKQAMVDIGGNLRFLGLPSRGYWVVGIKDPRNPGRLAKTIKVKEEGVSTSGGYENYIEIAGKKYCHIIDPRNGYPIQGTKGVTVVAPTAIEADALSTAIFILGKEDFEKLHPNSPYVIIELE